MKQFGFFLGIAIGVILILFGSIVIFQALPAVEQNFLEAFQTVLKLILLITFMWVCVKLVNMGVLIIRAGVDLIRTAIEHSESAQTKKPDHDHHFQ